MLRVTADNVDQQRTLRPLYANTQASPWACFLDPDWDRSVDIYPGMVLTKLAGEVVTLFDGTSGQKPWALSALFVAPVLGIDEVRPTGTNNFAMWRGGSDSQFEVLAPAFDTSANWTNPTDGSAVPLFVTEAAHAQGPGKITIGTAGDIGTDRIGTLIEFVSAKKIVISLDRTT